MRRNTIGLIWLSGLVLAGLLYVAGPDHFIATCLDALDALDETMRAWVLSLGAQAYDLVHALALALLVVFVVLGFIASHRGLRSHWALVIVAATFLLLVWRPGDIGPAPIGRWLAALVLALVGALVMTRRLIDPPPPPPWPGPGPMPPPNRWGPPRWPADPS